MTRYAATTNRRRAPKQGGGERAPFRPLHASAVRWGIHALIRTSSFHNSKYRPDRSLLSLRADKRERPEP